MEEQGYTGILLCPPLAPVQLSEGGEHVIGRSPDCQFPVSNADASRRHTAVLFRGSGYVVRDLGSTNGTFVNGERVAGDRWLRSGDKIEIGSTVIREDLDLALVAEAWQSAIVQAGNRTG